jgi:hypothetical protein
MNEWMNGWSKEQKKKKRNQTKEERLIWSSGRSGEGGANLEERRYGEKREQGFGAAVPGWESWGTEIEIQTNQPGCAFSCSAPREGGRGGDSERTCIRFLFLQRKRD